MKPTIPILLGILMMPLLAVEYTYDTFSKVKTVTYPNNVEITYTYDNASNLTGLTYNLGDPSNDSDKDGMSDTWEEANGFDPFNSSDGKRDKDGDGQSNSAEYYAGTDPQDARSFLKLTSFTKTEGAPTLTHTIKWTSVAGKSYKIQYSTDLKTWHTVTNGDDISATAPQNTLELESTGQPQIFYRVTISP